MFDNRNKRSILIFPKFKNIDKIQTIRNKYDRLANLISPHITLVFPFSDSVTNDDLVFKLSNLLSSYSSFKVIFNGISLSHDNYIFLNCTHGKDILITLHDDIYQNILPTHLKLDIPYIPHITLGQKNTLSNILLDYTFETLIDEICIEQIGSNEECNIIKRIKLN